MVISFSPAADALRASLSAQFKRIIPRIASDERICLRGRQVGKKTDAVEAEEKYTRDLDIYIRRAIESGDTDHIIRQLTYLMEG